MALSIIGLVRSPITYQDSGVCKFPRVCFATEFNGLYHPVFRKCANRTRTIGALDIADNLYPVRITEADY
jgi:hypothetical protein